MLSLLILVTIFYFTYIPESPKWLYTWKRYIEAKQVLAYVASFNWVPSDEVDKIKVLEFDAEEHSDLMNEHHSNIPYTMPDSTYYWNLVIMSIMWTAASFSFYLV